MGHIHDSLLARAMPDTVRGREDSIFELPPLAMASELASANRTEEPDPLATVRLRERFFRRATVVGDLVAGTLAMLVAFDLGTSYSLRLGYLLVLPIMVLVAKVQGLYDHDELVIRKSTLDEVPRLVNLVTLVTLLVWGSRHFIVVGAPSTWTLLKLCVSLLGFTVAGRMVARAYASRACPPERCLFVGDNRTARRLQSKLENSRSTELIGAITDERDLDDDALAGLIEQLDVHRIIISSAQGMAEERTIDLVRAAKAIGLRVTICPGSWPWSGTRWSSMTSGGCSCSGFPLRADPLVGPAQARP